MYWQYYLEKVRSASPASPSTPSKFDSHDVEEHQHKPRIPFSPPPLMRLSLWSRAKGRVAVMYCIAMLNWCAFLGWMFWIQVGSFSFAHCPPDDTHLNHAKLYYQDYLNLTPILVVARLTPMFICGILCNILVAAVVHRVPVVYLIGILFFFIKLVFFI